MKTLARVRKKEEHVDSEGSWAISYGDMITLLMSFFVLYFTVDHDKVKASQLQDSLMIRLQENGIRAKEDGLKQQMNIGPAPGEGVDPQILSKFGAQVHKLDQGVFIDFEKISFFQLGEVDVNLDGTQALASFAKIYQPYAGQYTLKIQAFTDTRKVKAGSQRYKDNLELSALRSVAAMRVLQKAGVPLSRMRIAGYGELIATQEKLDELNNDRDPLRYTRKVVLQVEPSLERN